MISSDLQNQIQLDLSKYEANSEIKTIKPLQGGDINAVFEINTSSKKYVVKINYSNRYPLIFQNEAIGLNLLKSTNSFRIPNVISTGKGDYKSFILLEHIETSRPGATFWQDFGEKLAQLHKNSNSKFGLESDNYIGSLPQINNQKESWLDFFIEYRLEKQIERAMNCGKLPVDTRLDFENLFKNLSDLIPNEPPSLLHGDLWSGNYLCSKDGPVLIDPSVYYGHREMDIAMTKLFGGFDQSFYEHYHHFFPMEKGWEDRIEVHNLYPLLVHLNLFGRSYLSAIDSVLKKFS